MLCTSEVLVVVLSTWVLSTASVVIHSVVSKFSKRSYSLEDVMTAEHMP